MTIPYYIIDTFTSERFKGNPTAVCMVDEELPAEMMHSIAGELNFPVTAFVADKAIQTKRSIKYFTVTGEIPACGHATLASAKVLQGISDFDPILFETVTGVLIDVKKEGDIIYMSYPVYGIEPFNVTTGLLQSLGLEYYQVTGFCKELETLFIEIESPAILKKLNPDYKMLAKADDLIKEVVVTSVSDNVNFDFLLRSFCPWIGIDEDPVTGSVHSVLAHYWQQRLGKNELIAYQASERGGEVYVKAFSNKVEVGGKAVAISKGVLYL